MILPSYRLVTIYVFHGSAGLRRGLNEVKVITTNVDNKKSVLDMIDNFCESHYGDKEYISGFLEKTLTEKGINLITNKRKNMEPKVMKLWNRIMLRKQFIIETVFIRLKPYPK
ncbi:transposase [Candidatus Enterovibrio escicola]|uniref:transposase n=2 Tax=Candidatus Enterovibrio escicola TaxID=1927127 RepID=UPI0013143C0F|nr:transposase [Candidatus Enterovibrio escacola]